MQSRPSSRKRVNSPQRLTVIDCLGRVVVPGELGALLAEPHFQLTYQGAATLLAHTQAQLRSKAVDLALDGEQNVDALDCFGRDRRLTEPCQIKWLASKSWSC